MKIEIKKFHSEECEKEINGLYINGELFDYLLDEESLRRAKTYCADNPHVKQSVRGDILNHFLHCLEEFTGRNTSLHDLLEAIRKGEIECTL